jgi:uncharacterized membrane protein
MPDAQQPPVPTPPSSTGLAPNVAGALAYLLGPLTGIIFFLVEKENRFVRFHAAQSIVVGIALFVIGVILSVLESILMVIPIIGWIVGILLSLVFGLICFALWLVLMYRAYQGREWEVPYAGVQARRLLASRPVVP